MDNVSKYIIKIVDNPKLVQSEDLTLTTNESWYYLIIVESNF